MTLVMLALTVRLAAAAGTQAAPVAPAAAVAATPTAGGAVTAAAAAPTQPAAAVPATALALQKPLRVGVYRGAIPCAFEKQGRWQGFALDVWQELSLSARLPYQLEPRANLGELLADTQAGRIDVAVGCITLTPDRVGSMHFSLPLHEDGIAVMVKRHPYQQGLAVMRGLLTPDLLKLLLAILSTVAGLTLVLWKVEVYHTHAETKSHGRVRTFLKLFQILLSGPGTNVITVTAKGHAVVMICYFVRIVSASILVGYLTLHVIRRPPVSAADRIGQLRDLAGMTVAARPHSVSTQTLEEVNRNRAPNEAAVRIVPQADLAAALSDVLADKVDAVMADRNQLAYLQATAANPSDFRFVLSDIRRQSQGFALSPSLQAETVHAIDQSMARLKQDGQIDSLAARWFKTPD